MSTFTITQSPSSANLYLYPNASSATQLTAVGQTENYECVDEVWTSPNEDTDYVYSEGSVTKYDWYTVQDHTTETGTINYVTIYTRAKGDTLPQSSTTYKLMIYDGTSEASSTNKAPLALSYTEYSNVHTTKPSGGAWTWATVDSMKIGVYQISEVS